MRWWPWDGSLPLDPSPLLLPIGAMILRSQNLGHGTSSWCPSSPLHFVNIYQQVGAKDILTSAPQVMRIIVCMCVCVRFFFFSLLRRRSRLSHSLTKKRHTREPLSIYKIPVFIGFNRIESSRLPGLYI